MRRGLLIVVLVACHQAPTTPTCEDVAKHLESAVLVAGDESPEQARAEHHALVLAHCTKDGWSAEARTCMASLRPQDDVSFGQPSCEDKLTPAQVSAMTVTVKAPPRPVDTPAETPRPSQVITVAADGTVFVAGLASNDDHLKTWLHDVAAKDPETQIVIRADKGTPHGTVVHIMELAKAAGLNRLAIGTAN
jgi:biopolymer transport protein ExbD